MKKTSVWAGLVALVLVAAVVIAGAAVPGGTPQAAAADPVVLTISGSGQTKTFTMAALQALPVYTGYAGFVNSAGTVTPPWPVKGVKVTDLLAEVGGIPAGQSVDVTAIDDYGMTFTYDEAVNGSVTVYDAATKKEEPAAAPLSMVLAYEENGVPIAASPAGTGLCAWSSPRPRTSARSSTDTCSSSGSTVWACATPSCPGRSRCTASRTATARRTPSTA